MDEGGMQGNGTNGILSCCDEEKYRVDARFRVAITTIKHPLYPEDNNGNNKITLRIYLYL